MKTLMKLLSVIFILLFSQCSNEEYSFLVKNDTNIDRENETVEIHISNIDDSQSLDFEQMGVLEVKTNTIVLSQSLDRDGDGNDDVIIFQPKLKANSQKLYRLIPIEGDTSAESYVFSRFVPERTDDYAWENDRVAFRTYGPVAQKMAEEGLKEGTLSSGMDCWLKKVDYPIIDKWYAGNVKEKGYYHRDHGEGLDNYHVGTSRGCGGLGVFTDNELYVSKNFTNYNRLENGPIRTEFTLDYEDWNAKDLNISEQKQISLDLGSNFMNVTAIVKGCDEITIGLTLHENDGETSVDSLNTWFSYTEPHKGSELETAIIIHPKYYKGFTKVVSEDKDKSQLLVHLKLIDGQVKYKTGFSWNESNQFASHEEWIAELEKEAFILQNPLELVFQ